MEPLLCAWAEPQPPAQPLCPCLPSPTQSGPPLTCFNVMTIITQVATGRRPSLQPVSDKSQQMVDLMRPCWDQEPKKRPCFPGSHQTDLDEDRRAGVPMGQER